MSSIKIRYLTWVTLSSNIQEESRPSRITSIKISPTFCFKSILTINPLHLIKSSSIKLVWFLSSRLPTLVRNCKGSQTQIVLSQRKRFVSLNKMINYHKIPIVIAQMMTKWKKARKEALTKTNKTWRSQLTTQHRPKIRANAKVNTKIQNFSLQSAYWIQKRIKPMRIIFWKISKKSGLNKELILKKRKRKSKSRPSDLSAFKQIN